MLTVMQGSQSPGPSSPARPRRLRRLRWLPAVAVPVLLVVLVTAFGGFRAADANGTADAGRSRAAGETVRLARWQVMVLGAEFVNRTLDGYETDDLVRVTLRLTWTGEESTYGPTTGLIEVRGLDRKAVADPSIVGQHRSGDFDPGVSRTVALELRYPDPELEPRPKVTAPERISVVIRDEERYDSYLGGESWRLTEPVAHVELDCPDRRERP